MDTAAFVEVESDVSVAANVADIHSLQEEVFSVLPQRFRHRILKCSKVNSQLPDPGWDWEAKILSTAATPLQVDSWVHDFAANTRTGWIVQRVQPVTGKKLTYSKDWSCQLSSTNKSKFCERRRGRNYECNKARIRGRIVMKNERKLKEKKEFRLFSSIIKVTFVHNHPVNTADSMSFLRMSDKNQRLLEMYFRDYGMNVNEAMEFHKKRLLRENCLYADSLPAKDLLADASQMPSSRTFRYLHDKIRRVYGPAPTFVDASAVHDDEEDVEIEVKMAENDDDYNNESDSDVEERQDELERKNRIRATTDEFCELLTQKLDDFAPESTECETSLLRWLTELKKVTSADQLAKFMRKRTTATAPRRRRNRKRNPSQLQDVSWYRGFEEGYDYEGNSGESVTVVDVME